LEGSFILAGFRPDLAAFLPNLDAFVLPSFTEGLPVVVLEAMAARVPVVATAVGGTPEVIFEGVTGHLVAPRNPSVIAQRLIDILPDELGRRRMGRAGRLRVEDHFTFTAQSEAYSRLFGRLTKNQGNREPSGALVTSFN
jgi:glycosyltransferase involved in cell wall biosynthesis